jgi:hypothetical protein
MAVQSWSMGDRMITDTNEEEYTEVSFMTSSDVGSKTAKAKKIQQGNWRVPRFSCLPRRPGQGDQAQLWP